MGQIPNDQAEGLRRLFCSSPPEVLAVLPCGVVTTPWVAAQLQARARVGVQMLALDERQACGNLADCLGVSPRFDLLQVVNGQVNEQQAVLEVMPGLRLLQVGNLARELGGERITHQRALAHLQSLQGTCDEWLLLVQGGEMDGLSPLALAAPRMVLVVDAQPMSMTTAWTSLRRLALAAPGMAFALCHAGAHDARSEAALESFCQLARSRLGLGLERVTSLGEAFVQGAGEARVLADAFIHRLQRTAHARVARGGETRFPGTPAHVRLSLP